MPPALPDYPAALAALSWVPLGAAGGLSGAELFRADDGGRPAFALKVWPPGMTAPALGAVHRAMLAARDGGCDFVPAVVPTNSGGTVAAVNGRCVDVAAWVPGAADADPSDARLEALAAAVAALHRAWRPLGVPPAVAPVVGRHLAALGAVPAAFAGVAAGAARRLRPWVLAAGPVHLTVGDLRLEHALFTGDVVTGLVDYGAAGFDHPAADLARVAADLPPGRCDRLVAAYNSSAGPVPVGLVRALALSGLVVAAGRWAGSAGPRARDRAADRAGRVAAWAAAG